MCIAVPGRVIEIDGTQGKVDVSGNVLSVELGIVNAVIGDYVLIHAGCAISVIRQGEAEELQSLLDMVDAYDDDE